LADGLPDGLFEAALLAHRNSRASLGEIDFYSDRERDFLIACRVCNWENLSKNNIDGIKKELERAAVNEVARSAIHWFLSQERNRGLLKSAFRVFGKTIKTPISSILIGAFEAQNFTYLPNRGGKKFFKTRLKKGGFKALEALDIMRDAAGEQKFSQFFLLDPDLVKHTMRLDDSFNFCATMMGLPVLQFLERMHSQENGWAAYEESSDLSNAISHLLDDAEYRPAAIKSLAYIAPHIFLTWFKSCDKTYRLRKHLQIFLDAFENVAERMSDILYTVFNREGGILDFLREREGDEPSSVLLHRHKREYQKFRELYSPAIRYAGEHQIGRRLQGFLDDLQPEEEKRATTKKTAQKNRKRSKGAKRLGQHYSRCLITAEHSRRAPS